MQQYAETIRRFYFIFLEWMQAGQSGNGAMVYRDPILIA